VASHSCTAVTLLCRFAFATMIYQSHYNTAITLLQGYNGSLPFHHYSKSFFAAHKKYGSKDRKQIAQLCYQYFRIAPVLLGEDIPANILLGIFLCQQQPTPLLANLRPELNDAIQLPIEAKLERLGLQPTDLFPFAAALSPSVDGAAFAQSLLTQPLLFLRLRPGHEKTVPQQLTAANIPFTVINRHCLALPNTAKADAVIALNRAAVVQDYSSQQVGRFFEQYLSKNKNGQVWDCCAASGGKSILLHDILGNNYQLSVSDIRPSILQNLRQRFAEAGITGYQHFVADLSKETPRRSTMYDTILCDAPCSGSGTWARTPEQCCFFASDQIGYYAGLQRQIVTHALPLLKPGGNFFYITCSVFRQENEDNVAWLQNETGLQLLHQQLLPGWDKRADSMFVAVFQR
jgi:16S rRNA (cytosine967-C5)-methyltransferase